MPPLATQNCRTGFAGRTLGAVLWSMAAKNSASAISTTADSVGTGSTHTKSRGSPEYWI